MTGPQRSPISHECCLWLWGLKSCRDFCPCCQLAGFGLQQGRLEIWRMYGLRKCHDFYPNASRSWYMLWIALEPPGWGFQTINKQQTLGPPLICSGTIYRHNLLLLKSDCNWHIIPMFENPFQTTSRLTDSPFCQHLRSPLPRTLC